MTGSSLRRMLSWTSGSLRWGNAASADAATSRACAARPSALAEQSPLSASELLFCPPRMLLPPARVTHLTAAPVAAPHAPATAACALAAHRLDSLSPLLASSPPALPIATTGLSLSPRLPAHGIGTETLGGDLSGVTATRLAPHTRYASCRLTQLASEDNAAAVLPTAHSELVSLAAPPG